MFDKETLKAQSARETLFPRLKCVRVRACVCVCVRVCVRVERTKTLWASGASIVDKIHTKYVKMAGLENIHLNTVYVLSGWERLGEHLMCVNILS